MCVGVPGRVVEIVDPHCSVVTADVGGVHRSISTAVLDQAGETVRVGDWVDIHLGFALAKIDESEALETYRLLDEMTQLGMGDADVEAGRAAPAERAR